MVLVEEQLTSKRAPHFTLSWDEGVLPMINFCVKIGSDSCCDACSSLKVVAMISFFQSLVSSVLRRSKPLVIPTWLRRELNRNHRLVVLTLEDAVKENHSARIWS